MARGRQFVAYSKPPTGFIPTAAGNESILRGMLWILYPIDPKRKTESRHHREVKTFVNWQLQGMYNAMYVNDILKRTPEQLEGMKFIPWRELPVIRWEPYWQSPPIFVPETQETLDARARALYERQCAQGDIRTQFPLRPVVEAGRKAMKDPLLQQALEICRRNKQANLRRERRASQQDPSRSGRK
jgi:hypothetical protein